MTPFYHAHEHKGVEHLVVTAEVIRGNKVEAAGFLRLPGLGADNPGGFEEVGFFNIGGQSLTLNRFPQA